MHFSIAFFLDEISKFYAKTELCINFDCSTNPNPNPNAYPNPNRKDC